MGTNPVRIADRMSKVEASGIRKIFQLVQSMKDPIDLSIGQADFDVPDAVKETAIEAIRDGFNRYTVTQGIEEFRAAIRRHVRERDGVEPEAVMGVCGASGGLFLAYNVLVNPGDEVLIPDPYFVMYNHLVNMVGGKPVLVDTYPDFRVTADRLERVITPRTRVLMLNNPTNPTGVAYRAEELRALAETARRHGLLVLADEVYDCFSHDFPHESFLKYYPEGTLVVNAFSKSLGMPGWRIGYVAGPAKIVDQMNTLQQFSYVCPNAPAQKAVARGLDMDWSGLYAEYRHKRDMVVDGLKDRFEIVRPEGAFYIFPKAPWGTGTEFCRKAVENRVLIVPGGALSNRDTHFRISYAASPEKLEEGVGILRRLADEGP